jgi:hypothetical protein
MSNANLLMLSIGPVSLMVNADRQSKGISEAQLARKWEMQRSLASSRAEGDRRMAFRITVDWNPTVPVECRRSSR